MCVLAGTNAPFPPCGQLELSVLKGYNIRQYLSTTSPIKCENTC
jgi:hypothetical protein